MTKPQIIVIDGPDGVGKTTQVHMLASFLEASGARVHTTRASGGTPIGEELRKASLSNHPRLPETDMYISLAMHGELGVDITSRRAAGEIVIVDRSPLAVIAYNAYGSNMKDKQPAVDACKMLLKSWDIDTFIFLDAPQTLLDARRKERGESDYFEQQGYDFHDRVRQGYEFGLSLLTHEPKQVGRTITIDASKSVEIIHELIVDTVAK